MSVRVHSACCFLSFTALTLLPVATVTAQPAAANDQATDVQIVEYPVSFFDRYQPNTALDIIRQVPGFIPDDGDSLRGFGGAVGNILINDRRPSAKQDPPSQILLRIPASQVEKVELIRGQVRGIDLQGHTIVVNVILREDAPAAARWEANMRYNFDFFPPTFDAGISISDRWNDIEYNAGISGRSGSSGDAGTDTEYDGNGDLSESTFDETLTRVFDSSVNLNASTWMGENFVQFNSELFVESRDARNNSYITPHPGTASSDEMIRTEADVYRIELGADAERLLQDDLLGKAILLFSYRDRDATESEAKHGTSNQLNLLRVADTTTLTTELIGRLEFDWAHWENHTLQANFEVAYNELDNTFARTDDTGSGPVAVDVPGANTTVEEIRGDFMFQDTWNMGALEFDYGLGGEISQISQTGDAEQKRDFFFLKPLFVVSYQPDRNAQTRARLVREIAQLDFNDFVSATVFEDDDLALGNPDLRPETTWISEISHERRFGELGVVTLTAFHHWIRDVQDLLPLTDEFEVPGNIGDGRRWGLELESAVPLTRFGLVGSRLDLQLRWMDSSVTDPVTGQKRVLSSTSGFPKPLPFRDDLEYTVIVKYRQDFKDQRISWGWEARERAERPRYKVNEYEVYDEAVEVNAFIETSRYFGMKIRLEGQDILDMNQSRDRTIYDGRRALSAIDRTIIRDRQDGARLYLSVSGSF